MMEDLEFDSLLARVSSVEHIASAYICSRAGNYVTGATPKFADRGMYSAITSLAFGTAEQVGHEMNDDLNYVSLRFTGKNLLIIGLGPRHLMGLLVDGNADPEELLAKVRPMIKS
jgi:predicted regulator of Ras-like GTPase activity (Roadblock/LC7/MglB family)